MSKSKQRYVRYLISARAATLRCAAVHLSYLPYLSSPYYKNKATGETSWYFPGTSKKGGVDGGNSVGSGMGEDKDSLPGAQI
jgi:hypothetical protein